MTVSSRPDLGPPPQLGYIASRLDRVAGLRGDAAALKKFAAHARAGGYAIGGELVVLKSAAGCAIRCSRPPKRPRSAASTKAYSSD